MLQPRTGLDAEVGAFIEADPDFATFFVAMAGMIDLLLPRFVQESKKYAAITIRCMAGGIARFTWSKNSHTTW